MGKINNPVELLQKSRSLRIVVIAIATEQRSGNCDPLELPLVLTKLAPNYESEGGTF
jgi:hypothetical protein